MQWQVLLFILYSHVYKMNTFSLDSVLEKTFNMQFQPPKMHFPAVLAQDHFCFLNERELQMN